MGGHFKKVVDVQPKSDDVYAQSQAGEGNENVLASVNQIAIKQHLSIIEALTDYDRQNR